MTDTEICFNVNTQNCEESNLFLRKFYEIMFKENKMGWNVQSFPIEKGAKENKIFIGFSNFGEVSYSYKRKGTIKDISILTNEENAAVINTALAEAKASYKHSLEAYTVCVAVSIVNVNVPQIDGDDCGTLAIENAAQNNISCTITESKDKNIFSFSIEAFGEHDAKYVATQKINYLKHLLCIYTNHLFEINSFSIKKGNYSCEDIKTDGYDNNWIENRDIINSSSLLILSPNFFITFNSILKNTQYNRTLRLILNSMQQFYCAKLMQKDCIENASHMIPGYVDLLNTTLVSTLEPISNINAPDPKQCPTCGQLQYSIRKKVIDLCKSYAPNLVQIINDSYKERSSFLHEGNAKTNEFYSGFCMPLINPSSGNSIMIPAAFFNYNLFDYVAYITRKVIEKEIDQ